MKVGRGQANPPAAIVAQESRGLARSASSRVSAGAQNRFSPLSILLVNFEVPTMSADQSSDDRAPVQRLAEEFVARHRRGECPSPAEYVERHPQCAERIHAPFPAP